MAPPPDSEAADEPLAVSPELIYYLDEGGKLAPRETARVAVVRDFDDQGNVIAWMTERLSR
jgi:hypothetical protein